MNDPIYGWFDDGAKTPAYNPPIESPCPYCGDPVTLDDVRTESFMAPGSSRSYFYRKHRTCDDAASDALKSAVIDGVIRLIDVTDGVHK